MQVKLRRRLHTPDIGKEARAEEQEEVLERLGTTPVVPFTRFKGKKQGSGSNM